MMRHLLCTLAAQALVSGSSCGGGSANNSGNAASPPPANESAQGLWQGTTSDNRVFGGLILDDGTYWLIYSLPGNSAVIAGLIEGNSTFSDGDITSSNGINFNFEGAGVNDFTSSGTYTAKSTLHITTTYADGTSGTVDASYNPDYDLTPSLAGIAGHYVGVAVTRAGLDTAGITVTSSGDFSGVSGLGCGFSGKTSVRPGANVYNVTVTFQGGDCSNGTDTLNGVAYYDAKTGEIRSAALNSGRTNGFLGVGTKQQ